MLILKFSTILTEIVEAPLNIYCYFDEKMYVKVPMTLEITLKNSSNSTLHLKCFLKNADNFMFAGNTQVWTLVKRPNQKFTVEHHNLSRILR